MEADNKGVTLQTSKNGSAEPHKLGSYVLLSKIETRVRSNRRSSIRRQVRKVDVLSPQPQSAHINFNAVTD